MSGECPTLPDTDPVTCDLVGAETNVGRMVYRFEGEMRAEVGVTQVRAFWGDQ